MIADDGLIKILDFGRAKPGVIDEVAEDGETVIVQLQRSPSTQDAEADRPMEDR